MFGFYKKHIDFIEENAVSADKRRYSLEAEAPRHYIDLEIYGDSAAYLLPRFWPDAVAKYGEDSLVSYGIVPWHVMRVKYNLTQAFAKKDMLAILRLSADLGHYIADAHVPLHTTVNYNGQLTGQDGIHGFWESRLPELLAADYDLLTGKAQYLENPQRAIWQVIIESNAALDSVLSIEKRISKEFKADKQYSFENRGAILIKVYSKEFSKKYHKELNGMVERRMKASIRTIGDFWFTAWVDAGQPDLSNLAKSELTESDSVEIKEQKQGWLNKIFDGRGH